MVNKKITRVWGRHVWRKQVRQVVIEEKPIAIGKIPLRRPRSRWEDCVKKDIKTIGPGIRWRGSCRRQDEMVRFVFSGVVLNAEIKKEEKNN